MKMKLLLLRSNANLCHHVHGCISISCSLRAIFFSSSSPPVDPLSLRILKVANPKASIIPVLDKWVLEGNPVNLTDLQIFIKKLRRNNRSNHALQISKWVIDRPGNNLIPADVAIKLDLISIVHGLEQAEKYFDGIPEAGRGVEVYGALLNSYAHHKCLQKAEATMQKMRELGFQRNTLSYNLMLDLYSKMGKHKKIDTLTREMEEKGIKFDRVTYRILLKVYATNPNIKGMSKLLMKMQADPSSIDWYAYVVAANGYLKASTISPKNKKAGLIEQTLRMLKKAEKLARHYSRIYAYESLITTYTALGNKDEVYRVWDLYKDLGRFNNSGYLCMVSSLRKLDDVDGVERIWEQWISRKTVFDSRIPNAVISMYSNKGLWEKAEAFVNKMVQSGKELAASSWDHLATAYRIAGQMAKAVETTKKAISTHNPGWKPNIHTFAACLRYLKFQGDVEGAEELLKEFRKDYRFSTALNDILKDCANDGNLITEASVKMEGDDQTCNGEMPVVLEFHEKNSTEL